MLKPSDVKYRLQYQMQLPDFPEGSLSACMLTCSVISWQLHAVRQFSF